ncbi:MAG: cation diffusion facilitator family transporter [Acidobacteria bacterium]|nr:cation diffusion facilitator family transporter [Acidobacteriota bacterium]
MAPPSDEARYGRPPRAQPRDLRPVADQGARVAVGGIIVSAALAVIKIVAGVLGNAYALIADGVESILDILSAFVVLGSLRVAAQPPNERFPYGYGKAEPLAGMAISMALFAAAVGIAVQSVREILTPHHLPAPFTLAVLVGVVVTKEILFRILQRTGDEIGSRTLETDAWHHRSDALTSLAAFIGISIALWAGPGYESADDWAALFACGVIAFNGFRLFRTSLRDVMDAAPPPEIERQVRRIAENVEGALDTEKCNVRRSGLGYFVDLHLIVDGGSAVRDAHEVAHRVKDALLESDLSIRDVVVHIEPDS